MAVSGPHQSEWDFFMALFSLGFMVAGLITTISNQPYLGFCFFGLALLSGWLFLESLGQVTVLEYGLRYIRPFGTERRVSWYDIDSARENDLRGRLELRDRDSGVVLPVPYSLIEYNALQSRIRAARPDLFDTGDQRTFKRKTYVRVLEHGIGIILLASAITTPSKRGYWAHAVLIALAAGHFLVVLRRGVKSVTLEPDALTINYPARQERLPHEKIGGVRMGKPRSVIVQCTDGTEKELWGFRGGTLRFLSTLESWVDKHQ